MTHTKHTPNHPHHLASAGAQAAVPFDVDALGVAAARMLREGEVQLPHNISERLRFARQQALEVHALASTRAAQAQHAGRVPAAAGSWWKKALATVPILAAAAGAVFMQGAVSDDGARATLETDLKILSSGVPPAAFSDPAFLAYLKAQAIELPAGSAIAR